MWSELFFALKAMDFKRANKILSDVDLFSAFMNPWMIAVMVITSGILLMQRREKALVSFLSVPALMVLFQKTILGMNVMALEYGSQNLLAFVGGVLFIAGMNVYFYFVR
jgi:hypothetical protein